MLQGKNLADKKKGLYFEIMPVKWRVPSLFEKLCRLCQQYINGLQVQTQGFACQRFIKTENVMNLRMNLLVNIICFQDWQQFCSLSYVSVFPALDHLSVLLSRLYSAKAVNALGSWFWVGTCSSFSGEWMLSRSLEGSLEVIYLVKVPTQKMQPFNFKNATSKLPSIIIN